MQEININWIDITNHLPDFIEIKKSKISGFGAFAKKNIDKNIFLGNYMGEISDTSITGPYVFYSHKNDKIITFDASKQDKSNWTRYMNCSINIETENVSSYFLRNKEDYFKKGIKINLEGYIVFYTNRKIKKGEELMYYYGDYYASLLNISYKNNKT